MAVELPSAAHSAPNVAAAPAAGSETVAVLGAGTIGASWAALFLACGFRVAVHDPAPDGEAVVRDAVARAWPALQALGLVADPGAGALGATTARLRFHDRPEAAVEGAVFIQESVPERLDLKHALFARIEPQLAPGAVVASSASGLMVREMQQGFRDPSRLILAHPFNPPHLIPLVELLANQATAVDVLPLAEAFYARCGRTTIRLQREVPGHVANRLQAALWREAIHLVVEGVATLEDVDKAVSEGPGLRWAALGPHMLFNLGAGDQGMAMFCERYAPSFHRWWEDLGQPRLTPPVVAALCEGLGAASAGRSVAQISTTRDQLIVAMLRAKREAAADPA